MISGKSFADRCDWVLDPRYPTRRPFYYSMAGTGDWVFINGDYIEEFTRRLPYSPTKRFNIIVHNSDRPFGLMELHRIYSVANRVYAINTRIRYPRLTTIPIGFVDNQLPFLASFEYPEGPRDIEIYANFKVENNREARMECLDAVRNRPGVVFAQNRSVPDYYRDLCHSQFVLCPEGTGMDTHRVYEALLCGATPVVLRNTLPDLYERLPVCRVSDWTDPYYVPEGKTFSTNIQDYL